MERVLLRTEVVSLTHTAGAYSAGFNIGGLKTLTTNPLPQATKTGELRGVYVSDKANQRVDLELVLFDANPSSSTITDGQAISIHDDDIDKVIAWVPITTHANYVASGSSKATEISAPLRTNNTSDALYVALVARGAPTYASTTDLKLKMFIVGD